MTHMYYIERSCFFFSLSKRKNQNLYSIRQATRFLPLSLLALSFVCFTDPLLQGEKHNILYHIISFYNSITLVVQINKNKNTIISLSPSLSLSLSLWKWIRIIYMVMGGGRSKTLNLCNQSERLKGAMGHEVEEDMDPTTKCPLSY